MEEEKLGLGRGRVSEERAEGGRKERRFEGVGVGEGEGMEEALAEREWRGVKRERKERGDTGGLCGMSSSSTRS